MTDRTTGRSAEKLETGGWVAHDGAHCAWEVWHTQEVRHGVEEHEWLLMVGQTPDMGRACVAVEIDGKIVVKMGDRRIPGAALRAFIDAAMEGRKA